MKRGKKDLGTLVINAYWNSATKEGVEEGLNGLGQPTFGVYKWMGMGNLLMR